MNDNSISHTDTCVQGGLPPCTCACPVNFNPRVFFSKLKRGSFDAAYREYANQVLFPGIVSAICPQGCLVHCPEKIRLLKLEGACVSHAVKKDPINFNLPARKGTVAIIGGGLSGLACAYRLATRRYAVTVFERNGAIGGSLNEILDESIYTQEFALQFKYLKYSLETGREIKSLDKLAFDCIYIATGSGNEDFGMLEGWDSINMATVRDGVFLGGKLTGGSDMQALKQGMIAAASMEKYLKVGSMTGQPETFLQTESKIPLEPGNACRPTTPAGSTGYTKEEAVAEAARCINCDCTACKDSCEFLKQMDMFPRKVESDSKMAASAQKGLIERVGTRMIVSCSVCGHCGSVCPKGINVGDLLIKSKKQLFEDGYFAAPLHDFYLRDMSRALDEAYIARAAPGYETASYMFFPGCQMTASGTEYVEKAYRYLLGKYPDTALMLGCCGVPALWAGNHKLLNNVLEQLKADWRRLGKPKLVIACATCAKTFNAYAPELEWISIYELIREKGLPESYSPVNGQWAVFDPCASRNFPDMQEAVRTLAQKLGARLNELPDNGRQARCCGMGGHIYPANPTIARKILAAATEQSELPYIAYCTNCRDLFLKAGKPSSHILDHVFGIAPQVKAFHISELKKNRLALKKHLLEQIWGEYFEIMEKQYTVKLKIPEELFGKMDKLHISKEDVCEAVDYCEQNNETVLNTETGILTGHLQVGIITYWVQYRKEADLIELINVYCHRLQIS